MPQDMNTPPILIIKQGNASADDIALLRSAGIAVMEVENPDDVRYLDPPLAAVSGIEALCVQMVSELVRLRSVSTSLSTADVRVRIAEWVMADARTTQRPINAPSAPKGGA